MGAVYRGLPPNGRGGAIKVLLPAGQEGAVAPVERERRLLMTLDEDSGFVPLLDDGESERGPYLVMPLVSGGTLRDRLKRQQLPLEEALRIGRALATAMGRAHALGIVHRDL